jgi:transcription initiation factor TFIIIB Brf1 subunit/transcription initiation factor TFIIB
MEKLDHIHIFKTNLDPICENCEASKTLDSLQEISQWTIDFEDVDRVLRVVSRKLKPTTIVNIIRSLGYECSELA